MKKLRVYLALILLMVLVTGCSTKSSLQGLSTDIMIEQSARFSCGDVVDNSGFIFGEEDEKIVLADAMKSSLTAALATQNLAGNDYTITTTILQYAPGNAFARWLVPGAGQTRLVVQSDIYSHDGVLIAKIPVDRSISAGGGFTVGAWKYIFEDVAKEIVKVLKEQFLGMKDDKM